MADPDSEDLHLCFFFTIRAHFLIFKMSSSQTYYESTALMVISSVSIDLGPPTLRGVTPHDQIFPTRRYYRTHFHPQSMGSRRLKTPAPPSSRSPTPEQKDKPNGYRLSSGPYKARKMLPHDRHPMGTHTRSRSIPIF